MPLFRATLLGRFVAGHIGLDPLGRWWWPRRLRKETVEQLNLFFEDMGELTEHAHLLREGTVLSFVLAPFLGRESYTPDDTAPAHAVESRHH